MSQPNLSPLNSAASPTLVNLTGDIIPNGWMLLADDDTTGSDGPALLGFERALRTLDHLNGHYGVRVNPGDDVRLLLPFLEKIVLVEVAFPGFRDGRGYSSARILREAGYVGDLRAVGDVLRDQIFHMLRCGFTEFLMKDKNPAQAVAAASQRFSTVYQGAADTRRPAWALRHTQA